ncbi:EthD domain-containing protein [Agrobacterium sp. NPDC090283]|uniref:EthD domain-containing protein n=1 Tax=Agrobacterium sp. NPDC090283 TaxID=3363920 RepID=UPI00383B31D5
MRNGFKDEATQRFAEIGERQRRLPQGTAPTTPPEAVQIVGDQTHRCDRRHDCPSGLSRIMSGMSREEFVEYYENNHVPLVLRTFPDTLTGIIAISLYPVKCTFPVIWKKGRRRSRFRRVLQLQAIAAAADVSLHSRSLARQEVDEHFVDQIRLFQLRAMTRL